MKISITCITPVLQAILDFSPDIISFQHVFHLDVGKSQIEWKLKVKTQISVFPWAKIGQNDHSVIFDARLPCARTSRRFSSFSFSRAQVQGRIEHVVRVCAYAYYYY